MIHNLLSSAKKNCLLYIQVSHLYILKTAEFQSIKPGGFPTMLLSSIPFQLSVSRLPADNQMWLLKLCIQFVLVTTKNYCVAMVPCVYCYKNHLCNSINCINSGADRNNFWEYHHLYEKNQEIIQVSLLNI
jgi:hypothetical protein